jgi:soluble lytic murein transglycosylase-like protein
MVKVINKHLLSLVLIFTSMTCLTPNIGAETYTKKELHQLVAQTATKYDLDIALIYAIIKQESGWNPKVTSRAGAIGLMQIMPSTGKSFCNLSEKELFDPEKMLSAAYVIFTNNFRNLEVLN